MEILKNASKRILGLDITENMYGASLGLRHIRQSRTSYIRGMLSAIPRQGVLKYDNMQ